MLLDWTLTPENWHGKYLEREIPIAIGNSPSFRVNVGFRGCTDVMRRTEGTNSSPLPKNWWFFAGLTQERLLFHDYSATIISEMCLVPRVFFNREFGPYPPPRGPLHKVGMRPEKTVNGHDFLAKELEVSVVGAEILFFDFVPSTRRTSVEGFCFCTRPCKGLNRQNTCEDNIGHKQNVSPSLAIYFVHWFIITQASCHHYNFKLLPHQSPYLRNLGKAGSPNKRHGFW